MSRLPLDMSVGEIADEIVRLREQLLKCREIEKQLKAMEALVDLYVFRLEAADARIAALESAVRAAFLEGHDRGYDRRGQGERDWLDSRAYLRLQEGTGE